MWAGHFSSVLDRHHAQAEGNGHFYMTNFQPAWKHEVQKLLDLLSSTANATRQFNLNIYLFVVLCDSSETFPLSGHILFNKAMSVTQNKA